MAVSTQDHRGGEAGLLVGVAGAAALTRVLQGILFGLEPLDMATFAVSAVAFGAVAAMASYLPSRRARAVDPMVALSAE